MHMNRNQQTGASATPQSAAQGNNRNTAQEDTRESATNLSLFSDTSQHATTTTTGTALEQFQAEKDEHQAFLVTTQHNDAAHVNRKANEMRRWEQEWEAAKGEGTNGVHR